ncbi:MAG: TonB-dependent receptor [Sphingomonas sp.]|jgi:iron complex outermembrane receptor protein
MKKPSQFKYFMGVACALLPVAVHAAPAKQPSDNASAPAADNAPAAAPQNADSAAAPADDGTDIIVYGTGNSRQLTEVSQTKLKDFVPGSSPLKALENLPGVNFQAADGLGNYEYGVRINIRGFNQNQLGFTLDGIPLGDFSYGNFNGLHISRALISENLGSVRVSQGAGALGTASTSNLGGTVEFFSDDPAEKLGATIAGGAGSNRFFRGYARLDTGEIGPWGTRFALSYVHQDADKYKGTGPRRTNQANFKLVQPLGNAKLSAFLNLSDRREVDDQDLSFDLIARRGLQSDYFNPDFRSAVLAAQIGANTGETGQPVTNAAAGTSYAVLPQANVTNVNDLYYAGSGLRQDQLAGAKLDWQVDDILSISVLGYYHHNRGQGDFYTPFLATPGGAPLSVRTTEYSAYRKGTIDSFDLKLGNHLVNGGIWFERNDFGQARRFYGLDGNTDLPSRSPTDFFNAAEAFFTQWQFQFQTDTVQTHIQDSWQVTPELLLNAGFKSVFTRNNVRTLVAAFANQRINGTIRADDAFLPQAGFVYTGIDHLEIFGNFAKNQRAWAGAVTGGSPFAALSQAAIDLTNAGGIRPEKSYSYELGSRFKARRLSGVVTGYYINFRDRLGILPQGAQIQGIPGVVANLGNVRSFGVETAATYALNDNVRLTGTYSFNSSKYNDNVAGPNNTILIATRGRTVPDQPRHLIKGDVSVTQDGFFSTLSGTFQSKRYVTFENDLSVPDRFLADITLGYNFAGSPFLDGLSAQVNVTNLFDKAYIATVNSGGTVARGDNQTLLSGAPRQVYFTIRKKL